MTEAAPHETPVVLVVDDEEIMQNVLRDILQESGYRVDVAENGEVALEKIKANSYDLAFTDIRMPRMDGMELLKRLGDLKPELSVIMMTGFASVDVAVEAMKLGAFDFITKPFNLEHIKIVANRAIEQKKLEKQAEEGEYYKKLSLTDGLTELFNHRYFHQLLKVEWSRSKRSNSRFCLFMIDVDDFKQYNDTLGHTAGDYALRFLAWLLRYHARVSDMVCRYGGEEFTIILPETNASNSQVAAERFRRLVEEAEFEGQKALPSGNLTVSIGMACFPEDASLPEELLEKADKALYRAKREGKNKVVAWADIAGEDENKAKEGDA